jgi:hypothetical protein
MYGIISSSTSPLDSTHPTPQNMAEEQFLTMSCFKQRGKLVELSDKLVSGRDAFV